MKKDFSHLNVGDKVTRNLGGIKMTMLIRYKEDNLFYCAVDEHPNWPKEELWRFDFEGYEYDPDLRWGKQFGRTGSFLEEYKNEEGTVVPFRSPSRA